MAETTGPAAGKAKTEKAEPAPKLKGLMTTDDTDEEPRDEAAAKEEAAKQAREAHLRAWPLDADIAERR